MKDIFSGTQMNKQSKKVKFYVIKHAALKNNRAYLLRTEINKSHLNSRICQYCCLKTSTVTPPPPFFITFLISPCPVITAYQVSYLKSMAVYFQGITLSERVKDVFLNQILTSSVIRNWTNPRQHGIYVVSLFTMKKRKKYVHAMTSSLCLSFNSS